ncbi:MAG: hypothetical protein ABIF08_02080 [Nanoarchaeota archaeon]
MGVRYLISVIVLFLIIPVVSAETNVVPYIEGNCMDYNVSATALADEGRVSQLEEGCYDIKVDITTPNGRVGEIYDPKEGWKSSYYYVNEICISAGDEITVQTRASQDPVLNFKVTLKSGSSQWESKYQEVVQDCPSAWFDETPIEYFLLPVLLSAVIMFAVIVLYVKKWKK